MKELTLIEEISKTISKGEKIIIFGDDYQKSMDIQTAIVSLFSNCPKIYIQEGTPIEIINSSLAVAIISDFASVYYQNPYLLYAILDNKDISIIAIAKRASEDEVPSSLRKRFTTIITTRLSSELNSIIAIGLKGAEDIIEDEVIIKRRGNTRILLL